MVDLGSLPGVNSSSILEADADGVNNGQIVGSLIAQRAYAWTFTPAGGMVDLGAPGDDNASYAQAVSDNGQVVGWSYYSSPQFNGPEHAWSYSPSGGMADLGTLGGSGAQAFGVNQGGEVVGASTTAGGAEHAFSWTQAGAMVDLGTLHYQNRSFAQGVNDDGQIVGYGFYESGGVRTKYRAFSYTPARGMVELAGLPGGNSVANAVNDRGDVVGTSRTSTGARHAVLWHLLPVAYPFLSCLPQPVVAGKPTICTATVTDSSSTPVTPTGNISFSSNRMGTFAGNPCTLSGTGDSSSCKVRYTPNRAGQFGLATHTLTATYSGDTQHPVSSAQTTIAVVGRATSTTVTCAPPSLLLGQSTNCTATVTDIYAGAPITPSGKVIFPTIKHDSCTLSDDGGSAIAIWPTPRRRSPRPPSTPSPPATAATAPTPLVAAKRWFRSRCARRQLNSAARRRPLLRPVDDLHGHGYGHSPRTGHHAHWLGRRRCPP